MDKNAIVDITYNLDIPFESQDMNINELKEICGEFATHGNKDGYIIGYNARHPMCMSCMLSGACMRLGRTLEGKDRLEEVKNRLKIDNFYSDNKMSEKVDEIFETIIAAIKQQTELNVFVKKDKLEAKLVRIFKETLKVSVNIFAQDFIERLYAHKNITLEGEHVLWKK